MKAIGIVGSPRKGGNTEFLTSYTLKVIEEEGIETEIIKLAGLDIRPCTGCLACKEEEHCPIKDDVFPIYEKIKAADAVILASPVYFSSVTSLMKALLERAGYLGLWQGRLPRGKVGGPLVVGRRSGMNATIAELTYWFQIMGFFVPGSSYWNMAIGNEKGEVEQDKEGLRTARNFGRNVALLMKKLKEE